MRHYDLSAATTAAAAAATTTAAAAADGQNLQTFTGARKYKPFHAIP